jgi:type I restriction enzyme S subunit
LLSVVREKGVIQRNVLDSEENHNFIPDDLSNYKVVQVGQFAMNKMKAWQGSYGVSRHEGLVSPAYFVFDLKGVDGEFFHAAVRSRTYVSFFGQASDGVRIGQWDLVEARMKEIPFFLPAPLEQTAIVRYLDHADRKVRHAIRARQQLIKLLMEQKQAIIQRAVTRGLDPNVRLKPSGVPWLGDIPEHWETRRLKQVARMNPSKSEASLALTGDTLVTFLPMHRVGATGLIDSREKRCVSEVWNGFTYFRRSDVLVAKITPCFENGKGACLDSLPTEIGFGSTEFIVLRALRKVLPQYLYRLTLLPDFRHLGADAMIGAAGQQRVPATFVGSFPIPVPPLSEQSAIVCYLNAATVNLDRAIDAAHREIDLLREYRTRLIADVVTGKLDVRDAAAHLPDEPEEQQELLDKEPTDETGDLDADESEGEQSEDESTDA